MTTFHIVIVTHNSDHVIGPCLERLLTQSFDDYHITILDSGSRDPSYLNNYEGLEKVTIMRQATNVGCSAGNNIAAQAVIDDARYVVFQNPDVYLPRGFLQAASRILEDRRHKAIGILGTKLLRYDAEALMESCQIDSTGIFQKWYGKWYDRGQGEMDQGQYDTGDDGEEAPAICGALMICRREALQAAILSEGEYFRNDFFMYKEDIELSLRMAEAGFEVIYHSDLVAWHARGWQSRSSASFQAKLYSARNELSINRHRGPIKYLYSLVKLLLAKMGV